MTCNRNYRPQGLRLRLGKRSVTNALVDKSGQCSIERLGLWECGLTLSSPVWRLTKTVPFMQVQTLPDSTARSVRKIFFFLSPVAKGRCSKDKIFTKYARNNSILKRSVFRLPFCFANTSVHLEFLLALSILCFPPVRLGSVPRLFPSIFVSPSLPTPGIPPCSFHSSLLSLQTPETRSYSSHLVAPTFVQKANKWSTTPVRNQDNCNQAVFGKKTCQREKVFEPA